MSANTNRDDIRSAAETIYHSVDMQQRQYYSGGNNRPPIHFLLTEDYLAGYMQDGRMSVVRRFFTLFVIFDLFFISLLWLICIMLTGQTIYDALKVQLVHYSIRTSLFDVVIIAFIRCTLLTFFYAILYINHWFVIFLTTAGSCVFLLTKVFFYNWPVAVQPVFQVLLIIVSCVLAWGEAWFLDCRVIPKEKHAQRFFRTIMQTEDDERSPLVGPYARSYAASRTGAESSIVNFYSPEASMNNSDDECNQDDEYRVKALNSIRQSCKLLESTEWKLEKTTSGGDRIYHMQLKPFGKVYRISAELQYPAKELFESLIAGVEQMPQWNPTLIESKILRKIDDHLDITYQASAPAAGGLVKSRDFVNLRSWCVLRNGEIIPPPDRAKAESSDSLRSSTSSIRSFNRNNMRKSFSSTAIWDEEVVGGDVAVGDAAGAVHTLSQSLGARSFASQCIGQVQSDDDSFEDANDIDTAEPTAIIRQSKETDLMYLTSAVAVEYDQMPPVPKYTRGENLIATWALRAVPNQANVCVFEWLLCLDLKGYFPRYILDNAYTNVIQEFMIYLRRYCDGLPKSKLYESVCVAEVHSR